MRYSMHGFEARGERVDIEIVDNRSDKCMYLYTKGDACTDTVLIGVRDTDLELLYEILKEFLGK